METLKKDDSVLFATFSPYVKNKRDPKNGNIEPFISFFVPRVKNFILIDQPDPASSMVTPVIENYLEGKIFKKFVLNPTLFKPLYWFLEKLKAKDNDTNIFFKIRDFLSVIYVGLTLKKKLDYVIGLESINALGGIFLRKIGKVKKAIYYVSDYSPYRYENKIFNWIYLMLDRLCCYWADYVWDVSLAIHVARIDAGLNPKNSAPVIHVPNALFPKYIKHLPLEEIKPYSLVFMGSLGYENGPDLAIEALPPVIKKFPKTKLYIIGGRKQELFRLEKLTNSLGLQKYVKFYGMIPSDRAMLSLLRQFYLALAPYIKLKNSVRWYGDSLKLRAYMACGLPVITTQVPPLGKELEYFGSAFTVKDNKKEISSAIIRFFSDEKLYKKYRGKAIGYGSENTWDNTFNKAFKQMYNAKIDL